MVLNELSSCWKFPLFITLWNLSLTSEEQLGLTIIHQGFQVLYRMLNYSFESELLTYISMNYKAVNDYLNFEWLFDAVRIRELLDGCSMSRHFFYKGFLQKHYHYNIRELVNQVLSRLVFNCHFWPIALPCGFLMHCLCFKSRQTSGKLLHVLLINLRCIWAMWEEINAHRKTATKRVHNAITSVMIFKNQVSIITTLGQGNVFTPVLSRDATKGRCHERGCHESGGGLCGHLL